MCLAARIRSYGEAAALVEISGSTTDEIWRMTQTLGRALDSGSVRGVLNTVPTYHNVLVEFDCTATDFAELRPVISQVFEDLNRTAPPRLGGKQFVLPTLYGGEHGPDLEELASVLGLSPAELIEAHTGRPHLVRCLAGPVGGPMMDGPPLPAVVPRQRSPRPAVPAGAVLLAGRQGFVKTMDGPGGWQVIGRTPLVLIDLDADPIVPWRPGDELRFEAITEAQWDDFHGRKVEVRNG